MENWKKLTNDLFILKVVQGYQLSRIIRTHSIFFPFRNLNETEETDSCIPGDKKHVGKTTNKTTTALKRPVSLFLVAKKTQDTVQWSILKSWISTFHKNASKRKVYFFWRNSPEERLYVQDLKDAYCAVPLHSSSQKYIKFKWKWNLYQFLYLCFCLSSALKVFSKGILKIPISIM